MRSSISVITCTHNPRPDYIAQVLEALRAQSLDKQSWEYLLIDNASEEPVEPRLDLSWHPLGRHVREDELGLTSARLRGIAESRGEILVFVDDDNVLSGDYLDRVSEIANQYQMIGAWGGQSLPLFEETPPEWTRRYWGNLAIKKFEHDKWSNQPQVAETMPCGAGLCVRKNVAEYYLKLHRSGKRSFTLDRAGRSLVSGGDVDLASCACDIGLGVGIFESLKLNHLMPKGRLQEEYLLRLTEGIAYSGVILNSFRATNYSPPQLTLTNKIAGLIRMALMNSRQRRFHSAFKKGESRAWIDLVVRPTNGH